MEASTEYEHTLGLGHCPDPKGARYLSKFAR
jgi:hypothetical protein